MVENGQTSADRSTFYTEKVIDFLLQILLSSSISTGTDGDSIEWSTAFQSPEFIAGIHKAVQHHLARAMAQTRENPTSQVVALETLGATTPGTQSTGATGELLSATPGILIVPSFLGVSGPSPYQARLLGRFQRQTLAKLMPYKWAR